MNIRAAIEQGLRMEAQYKDIPESYDEARKALRAAIEAALKMEQLNYAGCMEDLKEAEKAQPTLTVEALRQDFERQYKGHIGTTRMQGGRYLSPSIDDAWKAYATQFMQDDTALLRQALEALLLSRPARCGQSDELYEQECAQHRAAIAALRERLK